MFEHLTGKARWQTRLTTTIAGSLLATAAISVPAHAGGSASRYAGVTRYDTAAVLFRQLHACIAYENVVVASGEDYHDALASNFLAGQDGAGGMLLTQNDQLSAAAATELRDRVACPSSTNRAKRLYIADGAAKISDGTATQIEAALATNGTTPPVPVLRVRGTDAYAAAAAVATTAGTTVGQTQKYGRTAIVASGENFPDALAASPLVFSQRMPLLFTRPGALPEVTATALKTLGITTVILLGGTAAASPAVEAQLKGSHRVVRVAGANRQLTATALAKLEIADFGFANNLAFLARGDDYPDALAGGQLAGGQGSYHPILLAQSPIVLGAGTTAYLKANAAQLQGSIGALGGTAAISDATFYAARNISSGG